MEELVLAERSPKCLMGLRQLRLDIRGTVAVRSEACTQKRIAAAPVSLESRMAS